MVIHNIQTSDFCVEVEFEGVETDGSMWDVFVYASIKDCIRSEQ